MTPLEAWSVISGNLAHLYRLRRTTGYQGYLRELLIVRILIACRLF